jgi:Domain of unknown function (DUF4124)
MLRALLIILSVGLSLASTAMADVYKYKDDKGVVLYTDRPQLLPAERLSVQSKQSDVVDIEENQDDAKAMAERDKARKDAQKAQTEKKQAAESNAASKVEACNKARQDYLNRMNARRIYEEKPEGKRDYLDDKELDASRAAAKQAMDTLCN